MINQALAAKPADMTITTHICRGNFRSTWISEGGYEPVAEVLFGKLNYDGYFLEYDTDRAGGFEPLRFVPKGNKQIVLGLVSSKIGALEKKDDLKRRIDEATKYVALDQLCLSPQCGFASTEEGNVLSEDEQWAKLRMIVELANEVWKLSSVMASMCRPSTPCSNRIRKSDARPSAFTPSSHALFAGHDEWGGKHDRYCGGQGRDRHRRRARHRARDRDADGAGRRERRGQ